MGTESETAVKVEDKRSRAVVPKRQYEEEMVDLGALFESQPPKPDWEKLIEAGTVPALILGAERRTRRP